MRLTCEIISETLVYLPFLVTVIRLSLLHPLLNFLNTGCLYIRVRLKLQLCLIVNMTGGDRVKFTK